VSSDRNWSMAVASLEQGEERVYHLGM